MPRKQPEKVSVSGYLTIEPQWSTGRDEQDRPILAGASIKGFTKGRPERRSRPGTIVVGVNFDISAGAFLPLAVQIAANIDHTNSEVIDVEVIRPDYPEEEGDGGAPD